MGFIEHKMVEPCMDSILAGPSADLFPQRFPPATTAVRETLQHLQCVFRKSGTGDGGVHALPECFFYLVCRFRDLIALGTGLVSLEEATGTLQGTPVNAQKENGFAPFCSLLGETLAS